MAFHHDHRPAKRATNKAVGVARAPLSPSEITPLSHWNVLSRRAQELREQADKIGMENRPYRDALLKAAAVVQEQADLNSGITEHRRVRNLRRGAELRRQAEQPGLNEEIRKAYLAWAADEENGNHH